MKEEKKMVKTLIVASKVKELARHKDKPLNVSKDLAKALEKKVEAIIRDAAERTILNGRTTIMPKDL